MTKMPVLVMVSMACYVLHGQAPASVTPTCPTMEVSIVADKSDDSARNISSDQGRLISLTEGQIVLNVSMTTESAKRVQAFTGNHIGKMIAFIVNGRVINTPRILDPITGKGFLIGPFRREEAQILADSINHKESGCGLEGKNSRFFDLGIVGRYVEASTESGLRRSGLFGRPLRFPPDLPSLPLVSSWPSCPRAATRRNLRHHIAAASVQRCVESG
jgi:hypothetical protein